MRLIDEIVVHCSATPADWRKDQTLEQQIAEVKRWHVEDNGWSDIGYHFMVGRDQGRIVACRPIERTGAGVRGHNKGKVHICLFGGHGSSAADDFKEHFTYAQGEMLYKFIKNLMLQYPSIKKVSGHNEYAAKACPGFHVPTWWEEMEMLHEDVKPIPTKIQIPKTAEGDSSMLKGKRTFIMGVLAGLPALLDTAGIADVVSPAVYPYYTTGVAMLMVGMRAVTNTAPGQSKP